MLVYRPVTNHFVFTVFPAEIQQGGLGQWLLCFSPWRGEGRDGRGGDPATGRRPESGHKPAGVPQLPVRPRWTSIQPAAESWYSPTTQLGPIVKRKQTGNGNMPQGSARAVNKTTIQW